jgi:putative FmdB family regulatory protein
MPVYEYRCSRCHEVTSVTAAVGEMAASVDCEHCGAPAERILSRPSVHLSRASKLDRLDPKYDRMVDKAMSNTQNAEPDRLLKRMKPFPAKD